MGRRRSREILCLHLHLKNLPEVANGPALAQSENHDVLGDIVSGRKEGKALNVIPVKVGEGDGDLLALKSNSPWHALEVGLYAKPATTNASWVDAMSSKVKQPWSDRYRAVDAAGKGCRLPSQQFLPHNVHAPREHHN